jgi:hypothetical protein
MASCRVSETRIEIITTNKYVPFRSPNMTSSIPLT